MNTIEAAQGRWFEVLSALAIGEDFLKNRHGPCPLCGGKDRFRWDNRDGSGSYYCNQCGPGSGMLLLRKFKGWDFKTAANEVDHIIGRQSEPSQRRGISEKKVLGTNPTGQLLEQATEPELVARYLKSRGLSVIPSILKGHPSLPYYQESRCIGRYPAMLAPLRSADGKVCGVLRTYLADVQPRKKLLKVGETVRGGAVRLFEHCGVLGVCEGIETAIAAHELFKLPVWAAVSTSGMESFAPPLGVVKVIVLADHDRNYAGHKAAFTLAHRLAVAGIGVEVKVPPVVGDWNDVLRAQPRVIDCNAASQSRKDLAR